MKLPFLAIAILYFLSSHDTEAVTSERTTPPGLSNQAVPSLVLLGTAKGGTTDLWHILHNLGIGFEQYEKGSASHIQTRKELDFFSGELCTSSTSVCPAEQMEWLLRCPNSVLSQYSLEGIHMVRVCQEWLEERQIGNID